MKCKKCCMLAPILGLQIYEGKMHRSIGCGTTYMISTIEDADMACKRLVKRGIMRVVDIKFPLPYRPNPFRLISDADDYLSPKYLNITLQAFAKVTCYITCYISECDHTLRKFTTVFVLLDYLGKSRTKVPYLSNFGHPVNKQIGRS